MRDKVILYALGIGIFAAGAAIFNHLAYGKPIRIEMLALLPVIAPVFGYLLWLRWDWAPAEGRKARARRARERERERDGSEA